MARHRRGVESGDGLGRDHCFGCAQPFGDLGPARAQHHGSVKAASQLLDQLCSGQLGPLEWVHALMVEGVDDTSRTAFGGELLGQMGQRA